MKSDIKRNFISPPEFAFWFTLLALALVGVVFLRYLTPYGLGLINDSVGYIAGARNILAGNGYSRLTGDTISVPITNYPPMYSMLLALMGLTGLDIIRATRLLGMVCIAANCVLLGLTVRKITSSKAFALSAALLFILSEPFIWIHTFAITEPLYLFLNMAALLLFARYYETKRSLWLLSCGVVTSLAFLTRLVGLSIYLCIVLFILVYMKAWKPKIQTLLLFIASSLPGAAIWALRNYLVAGNASNRTLNFNPISDYKVQEGIGNFWAWLLPNDWIVIKQVNSVWAYLSLALFMLLLLLSIVQLWRSFSASFRKTEASEKKIDVHRQDAQLWYPLPEITLLPLLFLAQGVIYIVTVILTLMFLDSSPIFEHRILSPLYLSFFIAGISFLSWLWKSNRFSLRAISLLTLVLFGVFSAVDTVKLADWLSHTGQGFISLTWRESATVELVKELPKITLISNRPTALYLLAERPAYALLAPVNAASREERPEYWENIETIRESILRHEAMLVIFNYEGYLENPEESWWMQRVTQGLPLYAEVWDGIIFGSLP